jgi:hypothetical protein
MVLPYLQKLVLESTCWINWKIDKEVTKLQLTLTLLLTEKILMNLCFMRIFFISLNYTKLVN